MKAFWRLAAVTVLALVSLSAGPALAASPQPGIVPAAATQISNWTEEVILSADGTAKVTIDFTMDFDGSGSHGPFLTFGSSQKYDGDHDRLYKFTDFAATSPTGAPAAVKVSESGRTTEVKIGNPNISSVVGLQRYILTFTAQGLLNPASVTGAGDELYWNVIGSQFEIPLQNVTVTIKTAGPVPQSSKCVVGSSTDCGINSISGTQLTVGAALVPAATGLTFAVSYPAGSFPGAELILRDSNRFRAALAFTPVNVGGGVVFLVVGLGVAAWRARRGRDEQYRTLTPGLTPLNEVDAQVGPRRKGPVAVQFTPPAGFHVGAIGTLLDQSADAQDITASMVDLAVRGYLTITPATPAESGAADAKSKAFILTRTGKPYEQLDDFDRFLLKALFANGDSVNTADLDASFGRQVEVMCDLLYEDVTKKGWFKRNPQAVRNVWIGLAIMIGVAGLGLLVVAVLTYNAWGLIGAAILAVGVATFILSFIAPARTAAGTAVLDQTLGFKTYMATAEANQIRFEAGEDVFSKYLPYAIAFGLVDRWTAIFAELTATGRYVPAYSYWYAGASLDGLADGSFAAAISSVSSATSHAMTAATMGSAGGSAFADGGFSLGGGISGGGGGSW